jgi:hypothetical protein
MSAQRVPNIEAMAAAVVRKLHEQAMADVPDKFLGKQIKPKPWSDDRVAEVSGPILELMSAVAAEHIRSYHEQLEQSVINPLVKALNGRSSGTGGAE